MTQFTTSPDDLRIAYERIGKDPFVLLLHGFASSRGQNWIDTGWYKAIRQAGFGILALDFRGHGLSDKPHDPAAYGPHLIEDAEAVLAAVGDPPCTVFGYSMGGAVALALATRRANRIQRLILGGVGESYLHRPLPTASIAAALEAADDHVLPPQIAQFRLFADQPGKDRRALAACVRALPQRLGRPVLASIAQSALVMCGSLDGMAGAPGPLASALGHGEALVLDARNHMTAVGDKTAKRAVTDFLQRS